MPSKKILIIEDEDALLDMYSLRFEKDGYTVVSADNGRQGIELAKKEKPDLILLDVVMPEMDGYQVIKKLKKDPATKSLRVIFLSNLGQQEEIDEGLRLGAEDFVIKANLTPSALVTRVEEKIGQGPGAKAKVPSRAKRENGFGEPSCVGFRVLLIEDNEAIIDMYKMRLEKEGAMVEVARNGAWGIKTALFKSFDVIILDMVMPAQNGLEVIQTLKKDTRTANIPILVFSNSAQDKDKKAAVEAGAEAYFIKAEITPATLVREINKYCSLK